MGQDDVKIKLGMPVRQQGGVARGPASVFSPGKPAGGNSPLYSQAGKGGAIGDVGVSIAHNDQASPNQAAVRPSILILSVASFLLLILVWIFGGTNHDSLSYNDSAILSQYEEFRQTHGDPSLPPVAKIKETLNGIAHLENTGRDTEAKHEWVSLLSEIKHDKANPLYEFALEHLRR